MKKLLPLLFIIPSIVLADWSGRVTHVYDGDTVLLKPKDSAAVKVRLVEIDAPELDQKYGKVARKTLASVCQNKIATVVEEGTDKYQRLLGRLYCKEIDANWYQIKVGSAWWYASYGKDKKLQKLQTKVINQCIGLWADSNPIPPWLWRQDKGATYTSTAMRRRTCLRWSTKDSSSSDSSSSNNPSNNSDSSYTLGPKGGCYYINSSGNKEYVDRSLCN